MNFTLKKMIRLILTVLAGTALFSIAGCVNGGGNGGGSGKTYSDSRKLLKFTPASPEKQVLTEDGRSPQILITNYNETATDALGRTLPTSAETGLPKKGKYVGLFYSLWTSTIFAPTDVSKALAVNPNNTDYGPKWAFCFWAEPETGYHKADDVWQIKRDMRYFAMAGVDFLYIDMTNGYLYEKAMEVFLDTCLELRAGGQMTPYVVPWCFGTDTGTTGDTGKFYKLFMADEKYADLWFYWDGKPLALIKPTDDGEFPILSDENYKDKLTFRKSWVGTGELYWVDSHVFFGYGYGWSKDPDKAECIGIGTAGFANFGDGRSGPYSAKKYLDKFLETETMGEGIMFNSSFNQVMERNPECEVLLISRWNEWIAQNFTQDKPKPTDTGYVDEFNAEFSRDIEPMKGGFTDNYFYQMCQIIRKFKGVLPADGPTGKTTIDISGDFGAWQEVYPKYTDFEGDTVNRDSTDTTGTVKYVNKTGRNDIVETRVTADGGMLYVYAKTAAPLSNPIKSRNWMLFFIDADNDKKTGWEGYDFLVNYNVIDNEFTSVFEYKDNVWQEKGAARYRCTGNELMFEIPRSMLGLTGKSFTVNFHWLDNVTDVYDLESWFTTGDSAPERRNNYTLTQKIPYNAKDERAAKEPSRKLKTAMPEVSLSKEEKESLAEGLVATVYDLPENYGKMPDFRLIGELWRSRTPAKAVGGESLTGLESNFAVQYDGLVKMTENSAYTFTLTCDDCARLYVDGRLVAECAYDEKRGAGTTVSATGTLPLASGFHRIKVEYAEVREGRPSLSLDISGGGYSFFVTDAAGEFEGGLKLDLSKVGGISGAPDNFGKYIEVRQFNTVLELGEFDLSQYTKVEISYGSDGNAMLGDVGSAFAISDVKKPATKKMKNALAYGVMENATGDFWTPDRTVTIDLTDVTYSGTVYLGVYMADFNGVTIYGITFS